MQQQVGEKDNAMLAREQDRHGNFVHVPPQWRFTKRSGKRNPRS